MVRGNDPPGGAPADPNAAAPRVELLDPQGQLIQTIQLTLAGITVGRQPGNDLVLNAPIVSREHLRIDWDGRRAYVTDLSSRSGSRLAGALIPPDQRQVWAASQPLQIGPYTLRLLTAAARASQQPDPLLSSLLGDPAAPLPGQSSSGEGRIAVALSPAQVTQLTATLEKLSGKKVVLSKREDPNLLGGVVAKVGDTVYDGSLRTQLRVLRDELSR